MLQKARKLPYYAQKALLEGLGWAYAPPETWQRKALREPLSEIHRSAKRFTQKSKPCTFLTSGASSAGGGPLKIAFLGGWQTDQEPFLDRYESLMFQPGAAVRQNLGSYTGSYRRQAEILAHEVDLVAVVGDPLALWKPADGNWVKGPASLRLVFDFLPGETWQAFTARVDPETEIRLWQKPGLDFYIAHREADFLRFYREIYAPTVLGHLDGYGERMTERAAHAVFEERRTILFVEGPDNQCIAGTLLSESQKVARRYLGGVYNGREDLAKSGTLEACDYFAMKWALETGCRRYDAGICLPFFPAAELKSRKLRGGKVVRDIWHAAEVLIWASPGSTAGLNWLMTNHMNPSFVQVGGSELLRAYEERPQPAKQTGERSLPSAAGQQMNERKGDYRFEAFGRMPADAKSAVDHGLYDHALAALGPERGSIYKPFGISIRDEKNQVVGGLVGQVIWNFLHIDSLWVSPQHRGYDLGTRLMMLAENISRAEGIQFITLETTSFEAIGFYPKLGYEIVGQIDGMPPGHTFYYLKKVL